VSVTLNGNGIPHYVIHENAAWDRLEFTIAAALEVGGADAVCFGSLAQRSPEARAVIHQLLMTAPAAAWRVFDINLRQNYFSRDLIEQSFQFANVLKLNDHELPVLARLFGLSGRAREIIQAIAEKFMLKVIALTRGPAGSLLYQSGEWSDCPSIPVNVADTIGAGDAFTAALVMGLLRRMPLAEINYFADEVARFVCSHPGATPPLPQRFPERLAALDPALRNVVPEAIATQVDNIPNQ
jgi:fructokinase